MFGLLRKIRGRQEASESGNERAGRGDELDASSGTATIQSGTASDTEARASEADVNPQERSVPLDQIFGILSNQRRRNVLRVLTETAQIELGDLAERIAAREQDKPRERLTSEERKRVYVGLYQVHLPKLASVDAISYNKSRGIIEPGPTLHNFTYYLPDDPESTAAETEDRGWRGFITSILN